MKTKTWILILAALLLVSIGMSVWILLPGQAADRVEIWSEGELKYTLSLYVDQTLTITTATGSNTVTIKNGAVAVTEASCPDHYCMQRGFCQSGTDIVCLPNRLVIRFLGKQKIDGVSG